MNFRSSLLLLPLLTPLAGAQLETNRLQLDNEGDILWILNTTFIGSDPANGDYDGDLYYKIYPEAANTRCSGEWTWTGSEFGLFDDDWSTGAELYTVVLAPAKQTSFDVYEPDLGTSPAEIVIPGTTIDWSAMTAANFQPSDCPPAGFVTGFMLRESYIDTSTPGAPTPAFPALATGDYALTAFFPGGQSTLLPPVNFCGGSGDATLSWLGSTDNTGLSEGENQPDWTSLPGASAYGGFRGGGMLPFTPDPLDGGSEYALLMDGPTINLKVDVGVDLNPFTEVGLAGLNPQIGIDVAGQPTGTSAFIGVQLYSESSKPTLNEDGIGSGGVPYVGVVLINVGPTLVDLIGGCAFLSGVYSNFGLNPNDPALLAALAPSGVNLFNDGDTSASAGAQQANTDWDGNGSPDDGVYNGNMIPITPSPGLVNQSISFQAFTVDAVNFEATGSQIFRSTLRANI